MGCSAPWVSFVNLLSCILDRVVLHSLVSAQLQAPEQPDRRTNCSSCLWVYMSVYGSIWVSTRPHCLAQPRFEHSTFGHELLLLHSSVVPRGFYKPCSHRYKHRERGRERERETQHTRTHAHTLTHTNIDTHAWEEREKGTRSHYTNVHTHHTNAYTHIIINTRTHCRHTYTCT